MFLPCIEVSFPHRNANVWCSSTLLVLPTNEKAETDPSDPSEVGFLSSELHYWRNPEILVGEDELAAYYEDMV